MLKMFWKPGSRAIAGWLVLAVGSVYAQSVGPASTAPAKMCGVTAAAETARVSNQDVYREIVDPSTGDLWLLLRDRSRPGGPGRLVLSARRANTQSAILGTPAQPASASELPVIRAGDLVIVEEHTPVVDARLEAIALGSARNGAYFKARLQIGGSVVRVVAVSPGNAVLTPESERKP